MTVHLTYHIYVRNGMTRYQYIIGPPSHANEGRHVGSYPDVATAYHAAVKKGATHVYLYCPNDFPLLMANASDTRGMAWCEVQS